MFLEKLLIFMILLILLAGMSLCCQCSKAPWLSQTVFHGGSQLSVRPHRLFFFFFGVSYSNLAPAVKEQRCGFYS